MKYLYLILIISIPQLSFCQTIGDLDLSFGDDGIVVSPEAGTCYVMELQQDGKIVAAGSSYSGCPIFRYNFDGSLDTTFHHDGKVFFLSDTFSFIRARAILFQNDGKILIAGEANSDPNMDFVLFRFTETGIIDSTFGNNGVIISPFPNENAELRSAALQSFDGKIVVAGTIRNLITNKEEFGIVRYHPNGTIDSSFSEDGIQLTNYGMDYIDVRSMVLQPDGKIVVGGFDENMEYFIARFQIDGTYDPDFGTLGLMSYEYQDNFNFGESIIIQHDGKILLGGWTGTGDLNNSLALLMRVNSDGSLDNSFGIDGFVSTDFGYSQDNVWSIIQQTDDKIIAVGGSNERFAAIRYLSNGDVDTNFGYNGIILTNLTGGSDIAVDIAIQPDGNFILAGQAQYQFGLARYINDANVVINNFAEFDNSLLLYPNPLSSNASLQFTLLQNEIVSIYIHNIVGDIITTVFENTKMLAGDYNQIIQISESLPAGNYIISVETSRSKSTKEFTKI